MEDQLCRRLPQMVSLALCSEMEPSTRCEESKECKEESKAMEVLPALADEDSSAEVPREPAEEPSGKDKGEIESCGPLSEENQVKSPCDPSEQDGEQKTEYKNQRRLSKTNSWKTVRFQDPSAEQEVLQRESVESLFQDYVLEEWTSTFEELFKAEDWEDITDDRLLRKKVLEPGTPEAPRPLWGQQVTAKMQCVLEDLTVVEKDSKLVFVIGEGDVNQALEECSISMQRGEVTLLLADSQYTYGFLGREPDIPAWTPLLYQLQLLDIREKADPLTLPIADRIRIGNQKRERGNFHFQREEYSMAARAYCMALDVLTTHNRDGNDGGLKVEEDEVQDYRVKCLNNLAAAQFKLEQHDEALHTSRDVLTLDPNNVKALFRAGKLLSDKGEYTEAMEILKKALKLEPTTKAIHAELSKLVRRQSGSSEIIEYSTKAERMLGANVSPFLIPSKKKLPEISWTFLLGALVVALGSLVTSVIMTARN
ncbi:FKBP prolyl isomerase 16 [Genypterus blacodes]|uniref:FKBP prolyl isomerase 16 n=1 Tax=Genypterus blacodes TaxID=154954 RepID=UPI003F76A5A2